MCGRNRRGGFSFSERNVSLPYLWWSRTKPAKFVVFLIKNQGAPVGWIKMEPLVAHVGLVAMTKDAPHPNAGKLFLDFMASPEGQGTAVIINEFGAVGIDDALVRDSAEETVLLGNGCVCCITRSDLQLALRRLVFDRERGTVPPGMIISSMMPVSAAGATVLPVAAITPADQSWYHLPSPTIGQPAMTDGMARRRRGTVITPGDSCRIVIRFGPVETGPLAASLIVTAPAPSFGLSASVASAEAVTSTAISRNIPACGGMAIPGSSCSLCWLRRCCCVSGRRQTR